jgi:hypothetical protein
MPGLYSKLSNLEIEVEKGRISNFSTVHVTIHDKINW